MREGLLEHAISCSQTGDTVGRCNDERNALYSSGRHSRQRITDAEREEGSANTEGSVCTHIVRLVEALDALSSPVTEEEIVCNCKQMSERACLND